LPFSTSGFVQIGQRVRIRGGALDGVEGVLKEHKGGQKLVISVDLIQQSIELTVEGYSIELVQPKRSMPIEVLA
jgi:transcription antitermination factor NusG